MYMLSYCIHRLRQLHIKIFKTVHVPFTGNPSDIVMIIPVYDTVSIYVLQQALNQIGPCIV